MPVPVLKLCWYCGHDDRVLDSPEHVIAGTLGGRLIIDVCDACNRRANREVDIPLVRCHHLARARAQAGIRDARGQIYEFTEVLDGPDGKVFEATWTADEIHGRFLPVEIAITDTVSHIFIDPRDVDKHHEKQRRRSAARGLTYGPPEPAPPDVPLPHPPGIPVVALFSSRACPHPDWLWASTTAKITLGCLAHASQLGVTPTQTGRSTLAAALRLLAFEHELDTRVWGPNDIPYGSLQPAPTHPVAGALRRDEHLVAVYPPEHPGQPPLAQVVLFGEHLFELALPGLQLAHGYGWRFDAAERRVTHGNLDELAAATQVSDEQLALLA